MATSMNTWLLFGIIALFNACHGQPATPVEIKVEHPPIALAGDTFPETAFEIRSIFQDSKNNFWFGSNGDGVFKSDGKTIQQFTDKQGLCSNFVWVVTESKDGKIWFKTREGICYFDGQAFTPMQAEGEAFQGMESNLSISYNYLQDDILVGHYYNGASLVKIQLPQTSPIIHGKHVPADYVIYCAFKDRAGNLWFGTQCAGVCKYDGNSYTWLDNEDLGAAVRCIFEDKNGIIWMGNNGGGLFRYDGITTTNFSAEVHLDNPDFKTTMKGKEGTMARVWTITDDKDGNLWIGTIDAGVWKYDGKTLTNYTTKDGFGTNAIWTIYQDKNQRLWFGTEGAGVYQFDGKTFTQFAP